MYVTNKSPFGQNAANICAAAAAVSPFQTRTEKPRRVEEKTMPWCLHRLYPSRSLGSTCWLITPVNILVCTLVNVGFGSNLVSSRSFPIQLRYLPLCSVYASTISYLLVQDATRSQWDHVDVITWFFFFGYWAYFMQNSLKTIHVYLALNSPYLSILNKTTTWWGSFQTGCVIRMSVVNPRVVHLTPCSHQDRIQTACLQARPDRYRKLFTLPAWAWTRSFCGSLLYIYSIQYIYF